jgi:hypothetical protein
MDLAHSRPHRVFVRAPIKPFDKFLTAVEFVLNNGASGSPRGKSVAATIRRGDARRLPVKDSSIDLVLTSPPYLNAIDYMRCSKFSLVWMRFGVKELQELRSRCVGAEVGGPRSSAISHDIRKIIDDLRLRPRMAGRQERILAAYIRDMRAAIGEVARVLRPGGKAVYVIGENTVRGTYVRNSKILMALGKLFGLRVEGARVRFLPRNRRYLPPPTGRGRAQLNTRIRREVVLTLVKPRRREKKRERER